MMKSMYTLYVLGYFRAKVFSVDKFLTRKVFLSLRKKKKSHGASQANTDGEGAQQTFPASEGRVK